MAITLTQEITDRIRAAVLDPETAGQRIIDIATQHGLPVDMIVGIIERYRRNVAGQPMAQTAPPDILISASVELPDAPALTQPWTPPARRSGKRAQRQRERPWAR